MLEETTQKRITAELAEEIKNAFIPEPDREKSRPVIWPGSKIDELFDLLESGELKYMGSCQRSLVHLVCAPDHIRALAVRPRIFRNDYMISVDDMAFDYSFEPDSTIHVIARVLIGSKKGLQACRDVSPDNQRVIEECGIRLYTPDQFSEMTPNERAALAMAKVLEYYAFSPYTSYKERPTLRQAMNHNPSKKKWSAIEIVNLRIPKRRDDAQKGTGKKLTERISVTEHMRRQPTKNGIKVITIAEYQRGPIDAPLKPKTKKVYKVVK